MICDSRILYMELPFAEWDKEENMSGLLCAIRNVQVVVPHHHSRANVKTRLIKGYERHPEWQSLVKNFTWHDEYDVIFVLRSHGYECEGSITIAARYVAYRLKNLPLFFLPLKNVIEAEVEDHLELLLRH